MDYNRITVATLTRLARKAGIKSMSGIMSEELRGILYVALKDILLPKIKLYVDHAGRKTVRSSDVKHAIQQLQLGTIHQHDETIGKCKSRTQRTKEKHRWLKNARFYQKQSDCLYIPKSVFKAMVDSETGEGDHFSLKWSPVALDQLQIFLEMSLVDILRDANLCAIHASRQTVQPKDIQLAMLIRQHKLLKR